VDAHQKVLDKLQDASKGEANPQMKDMLSQAIGKVQEHLTKAKNIKDVDLKS
jgi:predicted outer membrane protein